jgi:hypothetical protein
MPGGGGKRGLSTALSSPNAWAGSCGCAATASPRAARLWLAVAVARLWLLRVGGLAEETIPARPLRDVPDALAHQHRATGLRLVSTFRRGWITIVVALLRQTPCHRAPFAQSRGLMGSQSRPAKGCLIQRNIIMLLPNTTLLAPL